MQLFKYTCKVSKARGQPAQQPEQNTEIRKSLYLGLAFGVFSSPRPVTNPRRVGYIAKIHVNASGAHSCPRHTQPKKVGLLNVDGGGSSPEKIFQLFRARYGPRRPRDPNPKLRHDMLRGKGRGRPTRRRPSPEPRQRRRLLRLTRRRTCRPLVYSGGAH